MKPLLDVKDLQIHYGMVQAVKGVSFQVNGGEIVTLIGANGAGKTTILKGLSGLVPTKGQIRFKDEDIQSLAPEIRVQRGFIHCPEGRGVFSNMTVLENLELGAYLRNDKAGIAGDLERVLKIFPRLRERLQQLAGTLSGGEQQMLAISRAMMSRPQILLLDEPSLGLAPKVVGHIFDILTQLNGEGMTILLVEQNAHMALSIAHRAYVLETGTIAMAGTGQELLASSDVQRHYLGM
jgi:branched-chain amino acid transport system ATP-binding protein